MGQFTTDADIGEARDAAQDFVDTARKIAHRSAPPGVSDKTYFIAGSALMQRLVSDPNSSADDLAALLRGMIGVLKFEGVDHATVVETFGTVAAAVHRSPRVNQ